MLMLIWKIYGHFPLFILKKNGEYCDSIKKERISVFKLIWKNRFEVAKVIKLNWHERNKIVFSFRGKVSREIKQISHAASISVRADFNQILGLWGPPIYRFQRPRFWNAGPVRHLNLRCCYFFFLVLFIFCFLFSFLSIFFPSRRHANNTESNQKRRKSKWRRDWFNWPVYNFFFYRQLYSVPNSCTILFCFCFKADAVVVCWDSTF